MALLGTKKSKIDLLARYSFDPVKHEKRMKTLAYVLPGAAIVLILAVFTLINLFKGMSLDNDIAEYEKKISSLKASVSDVIKLRDANQKLKADLEILENSEKKASSQSTQYDFLSSKLLSDVNGACAGKAEVKLMDYSNDGISFTFKTTAHNYGDISGIVKNIEKLEYFKSVVYTGYSKVGEEGYSFTVVCIFDLPEDESEAEQ